MANLLEKASILITPTAHDVGSINAIKPKESPFADLDFTRATSGSVVGTANRENANGVLEQVVQNVPRIGYEAFQYQEVLGNELIINGDFDTSISIGTVGSGWQFPEQPQAGSSIEYYQGGIKVIRGSNNAKLRTLGSSGSNTFPLLSKSYVLKYKVVSSSGGSDMSFYGGGFTYSITTSVGEHTFYFNSAGTNKSCQFQIQNNSEIVLDNISIKEVTQEVVPDSGAGHWLIEPQVTNTATDSNDFENGTLFNGGGSAGVDDGILTSSQATSPDGINNAWKFADNNDGNSGTVTLRYFSTSVNSGDYNVVSLFVKKQGNNDWFQLSAGNFDFTSAFANFNISNGTLGTITDFTSANIEDYGDGWYRVSATFTSTTDVQGAIQFRLAENDNDVTFTRNGTNGAFIYGIQAESSTNANATKPTSYIPTSNGQVTRAEDGFGLNTTLNTSLIDSTEGTFYAEMAALDNNLVDRNISLSDGDDSNTIRFRYTTTSNQFQASVKVGTSQAAFTTTSFDITNFLKIGLRFKENDFACFVNGSQVGVTDTSGSTFTANTLNHIKSTRGDGAFDFAGKIKCIAVFKEGLTDSELTCLTT